MAFIHEIVCQQKKDLTLVGSNLSINMDVLVAPGLIKRMECDTGNPECLGIIFPWRRAREGRFN